jgi:hypothetical protein
MMMPYQKDLPQLFIVRTSKSHYVKTAAGQVAPLLFTERGAKTVLKNEDPRLVHPSDGPYEMVPVTLAFGTVI